MDDMGKKCFFVSLETHPCMHCHGICMVFNGCLKGADETDQEGSGWFPHGDSCIIQLRYWFQMYYCFIG